MGVGFDQSLGRSFALKLDAGVDLPLLVYPGENLGFPSDGKVSPDGFNYAWRVGASVGYRLLPAIGAWGGVQMNQLKYSLRSTTETSIATEVIGYSETQFSLGLSLDW